MARILIIEDDETLRSLLSMFLEIDGHDIKTASNGAEGLCSMRDTEPDLILLDLMMPVMDGSRFLAAMQEEFLHRPQIIVLSAAADDARAAGLSRAGVALVLAKPVEPKVLREHVARVLKGPTDG
jgi:DNA-binding response OmpR family regulator